MPWIFRINGYVEILAGLILILRPDLLPVEGSAPALIVIKMYGILALAFGMLSLLISRYPDQEKLMVQGSLVVSGFHLFLSFQLYGASQSGHWNQSGPFIFHLTLAIVFILLFLKNRK